MSHTHAFTLDRESCTHTFTQTDHIFSLNTDAYLLFLSPYILSLSLSLSRTYMHTFSPKLTPLCTRRPANMQVLQKKSAYPTVVGKER